jgi:DNA-binding MarR family transcriptional regulator
MPESIQITEMLRQWIDVFAARSFHDWSRYLRTAGLSMPQFGILMHLYHRGRCGMSDISGRMEVSNAASSQLVERLVQGGLLERTEDPTDRRARQIALTDKGRQFIEDSIAERSRWVESLVERLTDSDKILVSKALPVLLEAFQKMDGKTK